jgi:predicted transcriptional regulator
VPQLAANVDKLAAGSLYARVVAAVRDFVAADQDWQLATIIEAPEGAPAGKDDVP